MPMLAQRPYRRLKVSYFEGLGAVMATERAASSILCPRYRT
jgi:hypothetical protein